MFNNSEEDFYVSGLLFLFTGIAIVVYLNAPAVEPRERDYAYAGSYYIFAIWIGLGVMAIADALKKAVKLGHLQSTFVNGRYVFKLKWLDAWLGGK